MNPPTPHRLAKLSYEAAFTLLEVLLAVVVHAGVVPSRGTIFATTSPSVLSRRSSAKSRKSRFRIWKPAIPAVEVVPNPAALPQLVEPVVVLGK